MKICHLTSVHPRFDNRIYYKECRSLAAEGFLVTLIVADGKKDESKEGITIIDVGYIRNRFLRILITTLKVSFAALRTRARIFHFHDPELMFVGVLLRMLGNNVIYDIHEDYVSAIKQKEYLHKSLGVILAFIFKKTESILSCFFIKIIAEKYYADRIKNAIPILNYPDLNVFDFEKRYSHEEKALYNLIYTGNITNDRGAYIHADIVNYHKDVNVYLIGGISGTFRQELYRIAGENASRLHFYPEEEYLPFEEIVKYYKMDKWLAGLAIFPNTEHYNKKELTKFFEYMLAGIPIIYSNFIVWDELIGKQKLGIPVDPDNKESIKKAIDYLIENKTIHDELRNNCILVAENNYSWVSQQRKLIELYKDILKKF